MIQAWGKALTLVALFLSAPISSAEVAVPPLKSPVTDLTKTLSATEIALLEQKLAAFEAKKGSQIAVLMVPTTQPETVEQFSIRVAEAWKLGRAEVDDGVLLVIAKHDRVSRIEVGYGLEGVLPDAVAKRIVEGIMVSRFREGNFAGGIDAGVERIMGVIEGEPLPLPRQRRGNGAQAGSGIVLDNIIPIFIGLIVLGKILQSLFGRFVGAAVMSTVAGFTGWLVFSSIVIAALIAFFAFFVSLFGNAGGGISRGGHGGWPGGGFGRGSGRGGFGGGGFSGGGGGFGGGGASGRW
ncbi:MAG: YgcG family protein [Pseudomonadota bacterium]|nr:YgcG family protein [Pseudomonadota bacterium]